MSNSSISSLAIQRGGPPNEGIPAIAKQTDFALDALEQALYARRAEREGDLVHHSYRGL